MIREAHKNGLQKENISERISAYFTHKSVKQEAHIL